MGLLENDGFLMELTRLFQKSKEKGVGSSAPGLPQGGPPIRITMKRYDGRTKPIPKTRTGKKYKKKGKKGASSHGASSGAAGDSEMAHGEFACLFRARAGSTRISTIVHAKDVNRFQVAYLNVIKGNMDNLKKLKKSKTTMKEKV